MQNGPNRISTCFSCNPSSAYQGHYIVLVGFDVPSRVVYYRNPSFKNKICSISFACLDEARKSFGTDEDIIYIYSKDD